MFICNHCVSQSFLRKKAFKKVDRKKSYFQSPQCLEESIGKKQSSSKAGYFDTKVDPFSARGSGSRPAWDLRPVELKKQSGVENPVSSTCGNRSSFCSLVIGNMFSMQWHWTNTMCTV